jgi:hypothetical protein
MLATTGVVWACMLATAVEPAPPAAARSAAARSVAVAPIEPILPITPIAPTSAFLPLDPPPGVPDRPEPAIPTLRNPQRHVGFALTEATIGLVGGMAWYYAHLSDNVYDFDYNWSAETWKKKLITFEAVRFDDNAFNTNVISHPLDATGWYLIFRGNHLRPFESFLLTAAYSVFWEFMVEYREVASINDMIATPMGGIAIGEPLVQTSAFLRAGSPSPFGRGLAALLNPFDAINGALDGTAPYGGEPSDPFGLAVAYPHTLELAAGVGNASFPGGLAETELLLAARAEVDARADLPEPGHNLRLVGPGAINRVLVQTALTEREAAEVELATKVGLIGGLWRASDGPDDVLVSSTRRLYYGLGSGFEYASRSRPEQPDDFLGISKLLGPMLDWRFANPRYRLHLSADAFYDFAAVASASLDAYVAANGLVGLPSVVTRHGYYYAQGISLSARAVLDIGRWELLGLLTEDDFWWIHGRDRFLPDAPEPSAWDRRSTALGHVAVRPFPRYPLKVTLAAARTVRDGSMGGERGGTSEVRVSTLAGLQF